MLHRSRRKHLGWIIAILLQFMLPAFASVADARAELESQGTHAHVESHGAPGCPRVHPADCAVCRVLAGGADAGTAVSLPVAIARSIDAEPSRAARGCITARLAGDPPQRAPPA